MHVDMHGLVPEEYKKKKKKQQWLRLEMEVKQLGEGVER